MKNILHLRELAVILLLCSSFYVKADYTTDQPFVELTRVESPEIENWYYWIEPAEGASGNVWIDWNNNNQYDEGEENITEGMHLIDALTIRVYGELVICSFNENFLTSIDVSNCPTIKNFYCSNNQIETLDVSMLTDLVEFCCNGNKLKSIDVSKNSKLEVFNCSSNDITTIDVSNNLALKELDFFETGISTVDISSNVNLESVACYDTDLTVIDVSNNPKLKMLSIPYTKISSIDVSQNLELEGLEISNTLITEVDLSKNTALTQLICNNLGFKSIEISNNTNLRRLLCSGNELTSLDLSNHLYLEELNLVSNKLTSLILSPGQTELYDVYLYENNISETAMESIVDNLCDWSSAYYGGYLTIIDTESIYEKNVCNKLQVKKATEKNWYVYDYKGGSNFGFNEYEGSEPSGLNMLDDDPTKVFVSDGALHLEVSPRVFGSTMYVYNLAGVNVFSQRLQDTQMTIDTNKLPKGQYIVVIAEKSYKVIL